MCDAATSCVERCVCATGNAPACEKACDVNGQGGASGAQGGSGAESGAGGQSGTAGSAGSAGAAAGGSAGAGAGGSAGAEPGSCGDAAGYNPQWTSFECEVIRLTNEQRTQGATCNGRPMPPVPPLTFDARLRQSARGHAEDMGTNNFFSHTNLQGQTFDDRIRQAGFDGTPIGENIAAGQSSPAAAMKSWLQSTTGHCENIMNGRYRFIGVGYFNAPASRYRHYWVQNFGG